MRNTTYPSDPPKTRPDIVSVITGYIPLRRRGRESTGLCPFHADKNPSLAVNEDKQVWYCHACSIGGDVIRFVELIEHCSFGEAVQFLGMADDPKPPPKVRQAARQISEWINQQIQKMNVRLRELDEQLELADELGNGELGESIWRERRILADLRDDLGRFECRADFVAIKDVIKKIVGSFE